MIHRIRARMTYANVMATIAVFVALGGSSYAAIKLPRNSVGASQIRSGAVRSSEIKDRSIRTSDLATSARSLLRGQTGAQGPAGAQGATGPQGPAGPTYWAAVDSGGGRARGTATQSNHDPDTGVYHLRFARDVSSCGAAVSLASVPGGAVADPPAGRATVSPEPGGILIRTYDVDGSVRDLPFNVVIAC
jgi:hypothetical protein